MLTICCVLKTGGDYTPEYVRRLHYGVTQNCTVPHRFVCFSDVPQACDTIPLKRRLPGWLSKFEIFSLDHAVYFDLDTVICGNIDDIVTHPHKFTMLSDFYRPQHPASGVMAWRGDYSEILDFPRHLIPVYRKWSPDTRGDAGWIEKKVEAIDRFQDILPGRIGSYKAGMPETASVCCYHGKPRPHETGWKNGKT